MTAESNIGARLILIGKDATLAGINEITAATARLNAEIASGGKSSAIATAGYTEQMAGLERLGATMDVYQAQLDSTKADTAALATVGKVSFLALTAAAAAWGYESIKWAQSYQTALVQLRTQAGLTVSAMNAIGAAAMKNAANLNMSPTAYVQAAYHPASTGMSVPETIAVTNYGGMLAGIGQAGSEDTVNALTGVMKSYNLGKNKVGQTAALLNAIVGAGNMHYPGLNDALASGIASTSKTFGISIPSFGGALAYMTDRAVPAAQAGTHLRMFETLVGAPTDKSTSILTAAGLASSTITSGQSAMASALTAAGVNQTQVATALRNNSGAGGIYNALHLIKSQLSRNGVPLAEQDQMIASMFGGAKSGSTAMMMYNNLPGLAQKTAQIDKNGTTSKLMKDWATYTGTFDYQLGKLGKTIETVGTQFGTSLLPPLTEGLKLFTDLMGWFGKNRVAAVALGGAVMAILVPAMGIYLKGALLKTDGAIMSVIRDTAA